MDEWTVLNWLGQSNYALIQWSNKWWWFCWAGLFFSATLIGMSPLSMHHEQSFLQIISVLLRRVILLTGFMLICIPLIMLFIYDMTIQDQLGHHKKTFLIWFKTLLLENGWILIPAMIGGWTLRFCYSRYVLTLVSAVARKIRRNQSNEAPSDILKESKRFKAKDFLPSNHYTDKGMVVGIDNNDKPILIPIDTWREANMQVIGPTRYGKGVILGCLIDQITRIGDTLFYIDPKDDTFAAHIMYQACKETGRTFYYVSMDDYEIGKWAPFLGGSEKDAFARLETAMGLEMTGNPSTDYYKTQEITVLRNAFKRTRRIESMFNDIQGKEANKTVAELASWKEVKSLCPTNKGFSIEKAIKENAVVYFKGSLDDRVIKTATKIFIVELVQECRRLNKSGEKKQHLTAIVDEVSFLVSRQLKEALATIVGFGVNLVNAYQSPEDLVNTDDINLDGRALKHSMDINSQIKAIYGGAHYETAEWAAKLSGTTVKEVTKMERTDVKSGGGETWENNRIIGMLEENLIHPNLVLTLPPRVCVFIQPRQLLKPLFTSFISVKDMNALGDFLKKKQAATTLLNNKESQSIEPQRTPKEHNCEQVKNFREMAEQDQVFESQFTLATKLKEKSDQPKVKPDDKKTVISHTKSEGDQKRQRSRARKERQRQKRKIAKANQPDKAAKETPVKQLIIAKIKELPKDKSMD